MTTKPNDLAPGCRLGRFVLEEALGDGGGGMVWRAFDPLLDIRVALKVLRPDLASDPECILRFKREILFARRIQHPAICLVHELHNDGELHFFTMELVGGRSLTQHVAAAGPLPLSRALELFRRLCGGVAAAHAAGVVHRDLKPANVIVRDDGEVKVLDFGVAWASDLPAATAPGMVLGTLRYIAPEVWRGRPATEQSDVYALGVMLYWLCTGEYPYPSEAVSDFIEPPRPTPPSFWNGELPAALDGAILRALAFDPAERFADVVELDAALAAVPLEGSSLAVVPAAAEDDDEETLAPAAVHEEEPLAARPRQTLRWLPWAAALLVLGGGGAVLFPRAPSPPPVEPQAPALADAPPAADEKDEQEAPPDEAPAVEASVPAPAPPSRSASRVPAARAALTKALAAKGMRAGDSPQVDALRRRAGQRARRGQGGQAAADLEEARSLVEATTVDKSFVAAKLRRLNRLTANAELDEVARAKLDALTRRFLQSYNEGRHAEANATLNQAFLVVEEGR